MGLRLWSRPRSARLGDLPRFSRPFVFAPQFRLNTPNVYMMQHVDLEYAVSADSESRRKREPVSEVVLVGRRILGARKAGSPRLESSPFHAPQTGSANTH